MSVSALPYRHMINYSGLPFNYMSLFQVYVRKTQSCVSLITMQVCPVKNTIRQHMLLIKGRANKLFSELDTKDYKKSCHPTKYINDKAFNKKMENSIPNRENLCQKNVIYSYDGQRFFDHLLFWGDPKLSRIYLLKIIYLFVHI